MIFLVFQSKGTHFSTRTELSFFSFKNSSFPAYLLTTFQECNGQRVELLTLHNFFRKKLRCLVLFEYEKDSREIECMFFLEVRFGCSLFLGWPFLYLKLHNQIWSHCFGVFFWHQTHISSRGILQQPKLFVVDETTFFCLKNLDRMLLLQT